MLSFAPHAARERAARARGGSGGGGGGCALHRASPFRLPCIINRHRPATRSELPATLSLSAPAPRPNLFAGLGPGGATSAAWAPAIPVVVARSTSSAVASFFSLTTPPPIVRIGADASSLPPAAAESPAAPPPSPHAYTPLSFASALTPQVFSVAAPPLPSSASQPTSIARWPSAAAPSSSSFAPLSFAAPVFRPPPQNTTASLAPPKFTPTFAPQVDAAAKAPASLDAPAAGGQSGDTLASLAALLSALPASSMVLAEQEGMITPQPRQGGAHTQPDVTRGRRTAERLAT